MSALHDSLAEYPAVRRALGYRLEGTERLLGQFLVYLDTNGADRITVEHAVAYRDKSGRQLPKFGRAGALAREDRAKLALVV